MRLSVAVAALCLSIVGLSMADDARASMRKRTDIPAEELGTALRTLAKERGFQLMYLSDTVEPLHTAGAVGEFTTDEALIRILSGTGLTYRYLDETTVTILPASANPQGSTQAQAGGQGGATSSDKEGKKDSSGGFRVAQVAQGQAAGAASVEKQDEQAPKKKLVQLEEVVVTGSRIPTVAGQQVVPLRSYTREDIEQSGQTTVADFLNTLPDVSTSVSENGFSTGSPGQTTVRLHGLPVGTTLVLLNGHRLETSAQGYFDLSNIPVSVVERVEVLPVGASAIYGADALAGAVNIILRRDLNDFEASGTFRHAAGVNDTEANLGWGKSWSRGSVSFIGTYQDRGELLGNQRSSTSTINFPAGVPTPFYVVDNCSPGNIYALNGQNLPGLSSPQAGIPIGISGIPTIQQFSTTAGKLNLCNSNRNTALIPSAQREGALLSGHYKIGESMDIFAEVLFSHEQVHAPQDLMINASGGSFGGTILGANNPYNPFGEAVGVSFVYPGIKTGYGDSGTMIQPLIGVQGSVFSDWHYEATAYLSHDRFQADYPLGNGAAVQAALNSSNPATALNPFTMDAPGTPQLLQSLVASATPLSSVYVNHVVDGQAMLRGPLFNLPAGPLEAAFGSEFSGEQQERNQALGGAPLGAPLDLRRHTYAAFAEARLPLLADKPHSQLGDRLALTLGGRYDHTDDFGGKATWQGGVLWRPTDTLSLSGSYGVSYEAPQLQQTSGGVGFTYTQTVADPLRGGESVTPTVISGSNPNLKPETGDSRTLGIVYSSQALHGLEAKLTYFDINISNYIGQPDPLTIINNPSLYPGGVVRAPATPQDQQQGFPGRITQINQLFFNFGDVHVTGFDADVRYAIDTSVGQFTPSLAVANIYKWQTALKPTSPLIGYVNQATSFSGIGFALRWKGTAALAWKQGPLSANLAGRYVNRYKDYQENGPNSNELGNSWIFDLNVRYEVGKAWAGSRRWIGGAYVSLGALNLFDRVPPFSYYNYGYDPAEYDISGRFVYTQLGMRW
jgi:iron complex outermembrane receptor protein